MRLELTIPDLQSGALGRLATRAKLERKERIELSNRVWKTRMFPTTSLPQVVGEDRIELSPRVPKTRMLALHHTPKNFGGTDETRTRDLCIDSAALYPTKLQSRNDFGWVEGTRTLNNRSHSAVL